MLHSFSKTLAVRIAGRTAKNLLIKKPICIALEVTHNCTANCLHCDKGPLVDDNPVGPAEYGRICGELAPSVIQIAGGEPLKREDILDIVRALYRPNRPPLLALVTNASLLTEDLYLRLRTAGIRQFSVSLDFPDSRHDEFRRIPGLFNHLDSLIPRLAAKGNGDITINTCITRANYRHLPEIAKKASSWGAKLNFSTYTDMRTRNGEYNLRHPEDTNKLDALGKEIFSGNDGYSSVMTSPRVFRRFGKFYEDGNYIANCLTGRRFLVVNPDGRLTPCAMFIDERYDSLQELKEKFAKANRCGGCYVSIRANTEKPLWELVADNIRTLRLSRKQVNGRK